jgi:hypothetical protein
MTVLSAAPGKIVLAGACPSGDAEILLQHLTSTPSTSVDMSACESAHTAVIQVLLACRPRLIGIPPDNALWRWVYPASQRVYPASQTL